VARAGALGAGDRFLSLLAALPLTPTAGTRSVGADGWAAEHVPGWTSAANPYMLADGSAIYSETQAYCAVLFLSGQAAATPGALVVEMGTLVGHSSRCLAAGLGANASGPGGNGLLYAAFDSFTSFPAGGIRKIGGDTHPMAVAHAQHGAGKPYHRYLWTDMVVRPVYAGPLLAKPGYIEKTAPVFFSALPAEVPVEVFSIDSAKSHSQFVAQAAHVWPRLRVGSVIQCAPLAHADPHTASRSTHPLFLTPLSTSQPSRQPQAPALLLLRPVRGPGRRGGCLDLLYLGLLVVRRPQAPAVGQGLAVAAGGAVAEGAVAAARQARRAHRQARGQPRGAAGAARMAARICRPEGRWQGGLLGF
jgi:hypothetical protein